MRGRAKFAALLAGVAAPVYFLIQLLLGADAGDSAIRAVIFFVVLFLVSLAIDWDKRARGEDARRDAGPPPPPPPPPS